MTSSNFDDCKTGRSAGWVRDARGIDDNLAIRIRQARPVAHQPADFDKRAVVVGGRHKPTLTGVPKVALTAIVDQAHNSTRGHSCADPRPSRPFGYGPLLHADAHLPGNEREGWVMSHKIDLGCRHIHSGAA
jgi:hypothetical protein